MEGWRAFDQELVVMGVGIEAFVAVWVLVASRKLQAIQERELEEMRLATAQANTRAAEANEKAEHERLERLRLEEKFAPRRLFGEPTKTIASTLRLRGPDAPVPIFVCRHDSEMMRFANDLVSVLQLAGWRVGEGGVKSYDRVILGVWIETGDNATDKDVDRVELLIETLRTEGIAVEGHKARKPSFTTAKAPALDCPIQILVGEKP